MCHCIEGHVNNIIGRVGSYGHGYILSTPHLDGRGGHEQLERVQHHVDLLQPADCPGRKPPKWAVKRPPCPYKALYKTNLLCETLQARNRPGRARTVRLLVEARTAEVEGRHRRAVVRARRHGRGPDASEPRGARRTGQRGGARVARRAELAWGITPAQPGGAVGGRLPFDRVHIQWEVGRNPKESSGQGAGRPPEPPELAALALARDARRSEPARQAAAQGHAGHGDAVCE